MSQDQNAILQLRLDQNYQDYLAQLREKPFEEIIRLAPEITAAQQLCDELAAVCDDDEVEYLLGLANTINMKWIAKEPPTLFFNGILTNSQLFCAFIKVPFISELFEKHIAFSECMMYTIVKFLMSKWRFYYDK